MTRRGKRSVFAKARRQERRAMVRDSYRDVRLAETVAIHDYPTLAVHKAEVLQADWGYIHPSLCR